MNEKYKPAELPKSKDEALSMAAMREEWSKDAKARDQYGSSREFELTALLLKAIAERL